MNFRVTVVFVRLVNWGEGMSWSPLKWSRGELIARGREWNKSIALT